MSDQSKEIVQHYAGKSNRFVTFCVFLFAIGGAVINLIYRLLFNNR